jgi:hypothetical protein
MAGRTVRVVNVEKMSPPITALPRGADCALPSPKPIAIGIMPQIMAVAVIRIARMRLVAPVRVAVSTS